MRFVIIGARGQLGREFEKHLPPDRMTGFDVEDLDVARIDSLRSRLAGLEFDALINLAAFHNVDTCEDEPARAFAVNADGALNAALVAAEHAAKAVFLSSDYVFGGETGRARPYIETDPTAPLNVYGASKAAGENLVRSALPRNHLIVRSSSLFGCVTSRKGSTFPELILRKARAGEDLAVVRDQVMAPTYARDLALRIIELLERGAAGTVHVTNGGACSWFEFASATLELAGVPVRVRPISAADFAAKARRPAYSVLGSARTDELGLAPLRPWRDALRAYLVEKGEIR